jgi:myosin-3
MGMQDEQNEGGVGGFAQWFHGVISRIESETLLNRQKEGTFLIRVSESRFGYSLSTKTSSRIKHFMIDQSPDGQYMVRECWMK